MLIAFTENGVSRQGNPIFEANPGAYLAAIPKGAICSMPESEEILALL